MLSRVAEAIYWMNRYVERAENVARFIDVNLHINLDSVDPSLEQWNPLVFVSGDNVIFYENYENASRENVMQFLTFDTNNPNSILSTLKFARENARCVRDVISTEMWNQINRFYIEVNASAFNSNWIDQPNTFYSNVKDNVHLLTGITDATMSHGEAWHFGRLGRMIERADKTSRILDVKYFLLLPKVTDIGTPFDNLQWMAVLKSASALEMYKKVWRKITPENVAAFLIFDIEFPRSIYYSISAAERSLHEITGTPLNKYNSKLEKKFGKLRSAVDYTDIEEIVSKGLHEFLDRLQIQLNEIGDLIYNDFFVMEHIKLIRNNGVEE